MFNNVVVMSTAIDENFCAAARLPRTIRNSKGYGSFSFLQRSSLCTISRCCCCCCRSRWKIRRPATSAKDGYASRTERLITVCGLVRKRRDYGGRRITADKAPDTGVQQNLRTRAVQPVSNAFCARQI